MVTIKNKKVLVYDEMGEVIRKSEEVIDDEFYHSNKSIKNKQYSFRGLGGFM